MLASQSYYSRIVQTQERAVKEVANPLLLLLIMGQQMGNLKDMSNHATVILHV